MPAADENELLDLFDTLNIDKQSHRRMAVYALTEFYKSVLTQIGRGNADLSDIHGENLQQQWGRVITQFGVLDGFGKKENYAKQVHKVKGLRNEVAHNTLVNPSRKDLEDLRQEATTWRDWLNNWSNNYAESKSEYSPRELLIKMMDNILSDISYANITLLSERQSELQSNAEKINEKLDGFESEGEITLELLGLFQQAQELQSDLQELREDEAEYEMYMEGKHDAYLGR